MRERETSLLCARNDTQKIFWESGKTERLLRCDAIRDSIRNGIFHCVSERQRNKKQNGGDVGNDALVLLRRISNKKCL